MGGYHELHLLNCDYDVDLIYEFINKYDKYGIVCDDVYVLKMITELTHPDTIVSVILRNTDNIRNNDDIIFSKLLSNHNNSLSIINFSGSNIPEDLFQHIIKYISICTNLKYFSISDVDTLSSESIENLLNNLLISDSIEYLNISNTDFHNWNGLLNLLENSKSLRYLEISNIEFDLYIIDVLIESLNKCESLTTFESVDSVIVDGEDFKDFMYNDSIDTRIEQIINF